MEMCKDVILCKGERGSNDSHDSYISMFEGAGYSCQVLPTLSFKFVNREKLRECLEKPETYSGIILTSQRSVEALNNAISNEPLKINWTKLPAYCVGPATENLGKKLLNLDNCVGSHSGNAQELAKFVISNHLGRSPLLYPCSEIARETIQQMLEKSGISVEKIVAYETHPSETLENDLLEIVKESPQIVVFFSPSIVKNVVAVAEKYDLRNRIKSVAIGPVTADALKDYGLDIYAIAAKPDCEALLESIETANIVKNWSNK